MTVSSTPLNFQLPLPPQTLQACVVIPARDEACHIESALHSLATQRDLDGSALDFRRFEILLLCNNCRDETAARARAFAKTWPALALHVIETDLAPRDANIGYVRRMLMDAACARLETSHRAPQAICSTDADTRVFPTWIAATLAEIAAGAEAVGGRILVANDGEKSARAAYLRDTAYRLLAAQLENRLDPQGADPPTRHFQFFGASLALTPRAYRSVGGLPRVECLEDVALERALMCHDLPVRHSSHVRVLTSARGCGRVAVGLSSQLREWQTLHAQNGTWLVPSALELGAKWRARRELRGLHARTLSGQNCARETEILSHKLRLNPVWLQSRLRKARFFGALWSDVERALDANSLFRAPFPLVAVEIAIADLRARLAGGREK